MSAIDPFRIVRLSPSLVRALVGGGWGIIIDLYTYDRWLDRVANAIDWQCYLGMLTIAKLADDDRITTIVEFSLTRSIASG
jgi:hypothetical protein